MSLLIQITSVVQFSNKQSHSSAITITTTTITVLFIVHSHHNTTDLANNHWIPYALDNYKAPQRAIGLILPPPSD